MTSSKVFLIGPYRSFPNKYLALIINFSTKFSLKFSINSRNAHKGNYHHLFSIEGVLVGNQFFYTGYPY